MPRRPCPPLLSPRLSGANRPWRPVSHSHQGIGSGAGHDHSQGIRRPMGTHPGALSLQASVVRAVLRRCDGCRPLTRVAPLAGRTWRVRSGRVASSPSAVCDVPQPRDREAPAWRMGCRARPAPPLVTPTRGDPATCPRKNGREAKNSRRSYRPLRGEDSPNGSA